VTEADRQYLADTVRASAFSLKRTVENGIDHSNLWIRREFRLRTLLIYSDTFQY
jgi:hypothetical protein